MHTKVVSFFIIFQRAFKPKKKKKQLRIYDKRWLKEPLVGPALIYFDYQVDGILTWASLSSSLVWCAFARAQPVWCVSLTQLRGRRRSSEACWPPRCACSSVYFHKEETCRRVRCDIPGWGPLPKPAVVLTSWLCNSSQFVNFAETSIGNTRDHNAYNNGMLLEIHLHTAYSF